MIRHRLEDQRKVRLRVLAELEPDRLLQRPDTVADTGTKARIIDPFAQKNRLIDAMAEERGGANVALHRQAVLPKLKVFRQTIRDFHLCPRVDPVRVVRAVVQPVMQADEIQDLIVKPVHLAIVSCPQRRLDRARRQVLGQPAHRIVDHVDRGAFQRLDEPAGQTDRHAVLDPAVAHPPDPHRNDTRRRPLAAVAQPVEVFRRRLIVRPVGRGIDIARANPVIKRHPPGPARAKRRGARQAFDPVRVGMFDLQGHGPVVGQIGRIIQKRLAKRLIDDKPAKPGAIHDHLDVMAPRAFKHQVADIALFVQLDRLHLVADMFDAALGAEPCQHAREFHRVQMIGIAETLLKLRLPQRPRALAVAGQIVMRGDGLGEIHVAIAEAQEIFGRIHPFQHLAIGKGVHIVDAIALRIRVPVAELHPELERGVGLAEEIPLGNPGKAQPARHFRHCRLTHAHGGDIRAFDQADTRAILGRGGVRKLGFKDQGGHPTRRPTTNDGDLTQTIIHVLPSLVFAFFCVLGRGIAALRPSHKGYDAKAWLNARAGRQPDRRSWGASQGANDGKRRAPTKAHTAPVMRAAPVGDEDRARLVPRLPGVKCTRQARRPVSRSFPFPRKLRAGPGRLFLANATTHGTGMRVPAYLA